MLHLKPTDLKPTAKFPVKGSNAVDDVWFTLGHGEEAGRVYINEEQYFAGVSPAAWDLHIGGYRVCEKWLVDRVGRQLGYEELSAYLATVTACAQTIQVVGALDDAIAEAGGLLKLI